MPRKFSDGDASIILDDDATIAALDRLANDIPGVVIRETQKELRPIMESAAAAWLIRYRDSDDSKGKFRLFSQISGDKLEIGIENTATNRGRGYAWFVRYSRRTRDSLRRELRTVERIARDAEREVDDSPKNLSAAFRANALRALVRQKAEAASLDIPPASKASWARWERVTDARGVIDLYKENLFTKHGAGAINQVLAGRSIWSTLVRKPGKKAAVRIAERLQSEITALARGE